MDNFVALIVFVNNTLKAAQDVLHEDGQLSCTHTANVSYSNGGEFANYIMSDKVYPSSTVVVTAYRLTETQMRPASSAYRYTGKANVCVGLPESGDGGVGQPQLTDFAAPDIIF